MRVPRGLARRRCSFSLSRKFSMEVKSRPATVGPDQGPARSVHASPSGAESGPRRVCPVCGASEPIGTAEPVWPADWCCDACGAGVLAIDGIPSFAPNLAEAPVGFDLGAFDRLADGEAGHYWFEPRNRLLTSLAGRFFPQASRYLEIGCGTGFVLDAMCRSRTWSSGTGSELHTAGLVHARRRLGERASLVQMDARHIPAREAFNLVGAYDVIEHIEEDEAVMAGVHASLAEGGGFIVAVPQHPKLWSAADDIGQHVRRYRIGELEAKLERAGFTIVHSTSYTTLLLPLMALSRRKGRHEPAERAVTREFDISPTLNRVLCAVLEAEVALSVRRFRWPVGGSRIVVARKRSASDMASGRRVF